MKVTKARVLKKKERRGHPRVHAKFIVMYNVHSQLQLRLKMRNKEVDAIMQDVSQGGMSVITNYPVPITAVVYARFIMVNDKLLVTQGRVKEIEVKGDVRYLLLSEKPPYRLGIKFVNLKPTDRLFIAEFVKKFLRTKKNARKQ